MCVKAGGFLFAKLEKFAKEKPLLREFSLKHRNM
jgi:hypothetical protein